MKENPMPRLFLCVFVVLVGLVTVAFAAEHRTISVSGTAVTRVVPDTVVWSVTVTTNHLELATAKTKSDEHIKSLLATATSLGAPKHCLQTGYLKVSKEYARARHGGNGAFKHFTITRTVTIKSTDTDRFDDYLSALVKNTDMHVTYQLETSELAKVRWDTRLKAMAVAKEKAVAMAKVLGAKVGPPLKINEAPRGGMMNRISNQYTFAGDPESAGDGDTTFAPGSIPVSVSVGVVFGLE
jgi:uncharacterized protein YggE